jgi:hypothetical protein
MALTPTQFQPGFDSGSKARRAGTARLPICCFQASAFGEPLRWASKPTPMELLGGRSTVIVVIRFTASGRIFIPRPGPRESGRLAFKKHVRNQYESTRGREGVRIGLSYYRRVFANVLARAPSHAPFLRDEPDEAKFVAGRVSQHPKDTPIGGGAAPVDFGPDSVIRDSHRVPFRMPRGSSTLVECGRVRGI